MGTKILEPLYDFLFKNSMMAWFWLLVRLYVGWEWAYAGYEKIINPVWVGEKAGVAVAGFANGALAKTVGEHPDVTGWYAWFLENIVIPNASVWSYVVAYGELFVGVGLILGLLTFYAAFFGFFMNVNYLLAGTVSSNPVLLILALLIMLAHRIAGLIGVDRLIFKRDSN